MTRNLASHFREKAVRLHASLVLKVNRRGYVVRIQQKASFRRHLKLRNIILSIITKEKTSNCLLIGL